MTVRAHEEDKAPLPYVPRQRDRRQALTDLLAALSRGLGRDEHATPSLRGVFEHMLHRLVPVRTVHLREAGCRWSGRGDATRGSESIALEVPGADAAMKGVLEATFDPSCRLGEWDFQILSSAAHIAALILELERTRVLLARATAGVAKAPRREAVAPLVGSSASIAALRNTIERVANTNFTVLLEGESGVGKELVARQIHEQSARRQGPFVAVNCAALVETLLEAELFGIEERTATGVRGRRGKFEHADGGTLFLDEVSDLSMSAQAKLLRVIQDLAIERVGATGAHQVDIRIVAATNRSLAQMVERQRFRADLFYRLSGVDVQVPPLRTRPADILDLAAHFLERHRSMRRLRLSASAAEALCIYGWPGNVRELERLIERAVAMTETDTIELDDLPAHVRGDYAAVMLPALKRPETLRIWAGRYVRLVLDRCQGNKRETSRVLGISYHTLQTYLKEPLPDADNESSDDASIELCSPGVSG